VPDRSRPAAAKLAAARVPLHHRRRVAQYHGGRRRGPIHHGPRTIGLFRVQDGVKQEIVFFARRPQPIALSLLLDSSASMEDKLQTLQVAALNFVRRLKTNDLASDRLRRVSIRRDSRQTSAS
jgi:hypothetical protein